MGERFGLRGSLAYLAEHLSSGLNARITTELKNGGEEFPGGPLPPEIASVDVVRIVDRNLVQASLVGTYDLLQVGHRAALSLLAGPGFSFSLGSSHHETVELDTSVRPYARFANRQLLPTERNGRMMIAYSSDIGSSGPPESSTRLGLILGTQFRIRASEFLSVVSSLEYELPLSFIDDPTGEGGPHSLQMKAGAVLYIR